MGLMEIIIIVLTATVIVEGGYIFWMHRRLEVLEAFCCNLDEAMELDFVFIPDKDLKKKWAENEQKKEDESKPDKT